MIIEIVSLWWRTGAQEQLRQRGSGVSLALLPASLEDVDGRWLSAVLGVDGIEVVRVGPLGAGHMADTYLLTLAGAPWRELVLKLSAADDGSRAVAERHRAYEVEVGFYRDVAPSLSVRIPTYHWGAHDPDSGRYAVLLEHVEGAVAGDQLTGCTPREAGAALTELALLHATHWGDESLAQLAWFGRHADGYRAANVARARAGLARFLDWYGERLATEVIELTMRFAGMISRYDRRGQRGPRTVGHGDFRADNLLFGHDRVCVVDWQTAFFGHGLVDVSYFLGGSLTVEDRRRHEERLVRDYHACLVDQGVQLSWADCWRAYRRHAFEGLATALFSAPGVKRTERGDELFVTMTERAARHVLDLDAEPLLDDDHRCGQRWTLGAR